MLLLALDTATPAVTVALHDGSQVVGSAHGSDGRRHGEVLAPMIEQLLVEHGASPADLTDIAVGVGPGPFTGLRVGVVTALTLGAALGLPVHGVCSLDALAHVADFAAGPVLVATDARRREIYWAVYLGPDRRVGDAAVGRPGEVAASLGAQRDGQAGAEAGAAGLAAGLTATGPGADLYADALGLPVAASQPLSAGALAEVAVGRLGAGLPLLEPYPLYLRRPDAVPSVTRKSVLT